MSALRGPQVYTQTHGSETRDLTLARRGAILRAPCLGDHTGRPLGRPEDVVAPFMFLIGDGAAAVSGVTLWMRNP